jgi:hypothetical protein
MTGSVKTGLLKLTDNATASATGELVFGHNSGVPTLHYNNTTSGTLATLGAQTFTGLQTFNAGATIASGQVLRVGGTNPATALGRIAYQSPISTDSALIHHVITGAVNFGYGVDTNNYITIGTLTALDTWGVKGFQMSNAGHVFLNAGATVSAAGLSVAGNIDSFTGGVRSILDNNSGELRLTAGVSTGGSSTLKSYVHNAGTAVEWLGVSSTGAVTFPTNTTHTFGAGGTGSGDTTLVINAGDGAGGEAILSFQRNSVTEALIYNNGTTDYRFRTTSLPIVLAPGNVDTITASSTAITLSQPVTATSINASSGDTASLGSGAAADIATTVSTGVYLVHVMGNSNSTQYAQGYAYSNNSGGVTVTTIAGTALTLGSSGTNKITVTNSSTTQTIKYTVLRIL